MLSILIPAYRNAETLLRLLHSIEGMTLPFVYEIVVSDDSVPLYIEKCQYIMDLEKDGILRWYSQERNLGVLDNGVFLAEVARYRFAVFAQHDDFYTDTSFFERAVTALLDTPDGRFVFANATFEGSHAPMFRAGDTSFRIGSCEFAKLFWSGLMTSWTSIVFDNKILRELGGFGVGYTLSTAEGRKLSAYSQEEGMAFLYLLLMNPKSCAIIDPVAVSVRGLPPTRFSTAEDHPGRLVDNDSLFFVYWNIHQLIVANGLAGRCLSMRILLRACRFGLKNANKDVKIYLGAGFKASIVIQVAHLFYFFNRAVHAYRQSIGAARARVKVGLKYLGFFKND